MPEPPHPRLLRREAAVQFATDVYANSLSLTQELSNYGSNLLVRCLARPDRTLADVVVCAVLLKHVTAMLDSVQVLVSQGCTNAAFLVGRAVFESSVYIEWILMADTERKAQHYWVAHLRKERIWARRCIAESDEFAAARNDLGQFGEDILKARPMLQDMAPAQLERIDRMLASPASVEIDKAFTKLKRKNRPLFEPHWHEPLGVKSLRDLARQLQRLTEYEILYNKGSEISHGDVLGEHARIHEGRAQLRVIRDFKGTYQLLMGVNSVAIHTFDRVLRYYRADELPAMWRQYMSEWRERFLNVPNDPADGTEVVEEWRR